MVVTGIVTSVAIEKSLRAPVPRAPFKAISIAALLLPVSREFLISTIAFQNPYPQSEPELLARALS
jgi:hypothetical protein